MQVIRFIAGACAALVVSAAHALTITDCCDWASASWAYSSFSVGVGSASALREAASGNPGARLNITTVTPTISDTAYATAVYQGFVGAAPAAGTPFTLSLDVLSGAGGFGGGQAIQLLVEQGGTVYATSVGATGWPINAFTTIPFNGTFTAASFTRVIGAGPATPAFDAITPTHFGFAAGNTQSATLTQYYDNFTLTFAAAPPVSFGTSSTNIPTLSEWSLVLLALLVALAPFALGRVRR